MRNVILILSLLNCVAGKLFSQSATNWIAQDPFDCNVFIENKGQFTNSEEGDVGGKILYYSRKGQLHLYFLKDALVFRYDSSYIRKAWGEEEEIEPENVRTRPVFMKMNWKGANPDVRVDVENMVGNYFTYGDREDKTGTTSITARGWKKLTYKNIYQGIDVEFYFPEDKGGVEYNIVVHPGADPSNIKMNYTKNSSVTLSGKDVTIRSPFTNFIDHAPTAKQEDGKDVITSFGVAGNSVSFNIAAYDQSQTLIIDPWITATKLTKLNKAYDIAYDNLGNVYVYGGFNPYQECKYNSAGTLLWTYTTTFTYNYFNMGGFYGDLEVDRRTGSSYIPEGFNYSGTGSQVLKISPNGSQIAVFTGKPDLNEMWRCEYDYCDNILVIAGGADKGLTPQAATLDSSCKTLNVQNVLGASADQHDMSLLAIPKDVGGLCYMATNKSTGQTANLYDNVLMQLPLPSFSPTAYMVPDNHKFVELISQSYYPNLSLGALTQMASNGYNGMAAIAKFTITYDGATMRKWRPSGAFVNSVAITGGKAFQYGGLDIDCQGNIYAGYLKSIRVYDSTLNFIGSIPLKDTVYDLNIGVNWNVYSCGRGFVESDKMINIPTMKQVTTTQTTASTCKSFDATANATAVFCGGVPPYTYSWSNGQIGQTATGLAMGTYTVTAKDASACVPIQDTAIVHILGPPSAFTVTPASTNVICFGGNNGSASVGIVGGTAPFTYSWSNNAISSSINGIPAGTYTCEITDNTAGGCPGTITVTITQPPALKLSASSSDLACNGVCTGTASILSSGGSAPYNYSWSNGSTLASTTSLCAGTYTVVLSDKNNCTQDTSITINSPVALSHTSTSTAATCGKKDGSVSINESGGVPTYSYLWNTGAVTSKISNVASGNYTVTVKDSKGCTEAVQMNVPGSLPGTLQIDPPVQLPCFGDKNGTISVSITGGSGPYTYAWSNGALATTTISNLGAGTYTVSITDKNGCVGTAMDSVIQPPPLFLPSMSQIICNGLAATLTSNANGGTAPYSYLWSNADTASSLTDSPNTTTAYTLETTDANGCKISQTDTIFINPVPQAAFRAPNVCVGIPTVFQDSSYLPTVQNGTISSWSWNFGDGTNSVSQSPVHIYSTAGTYTVSLTVAEGPCASAITHTVTVYPLPKADFSVSPETASVSDPVITIADLSTGGVKGNWYFGDMTDTSYVPGMNHIHTYPADNKPGGETYTVKLNIVNQYGCPDSILKVIHLDPEWAFYVPNAFSPNGDDKNEVFFGTGFGILEKEMWIWDRWGLLIFHTTEIDGAWDGRVQNGNSGELAQQDVYVWRIDIKEIFGKHHRYMGHVTLVR